MARRDAIHDIFTREVARAEGRNLVVFWSGHGTVDRDHERALFTSDAHVSDLRNVRLNLLVEYLYDANIANLHQQIVIVDACANYVEDMQNTTSLTRSTFPVSENTRNDVSQFQLLAAAQGRTAAHDQLARAGRFSDIVFAYLHNESGPQWPPDMPGLSERVDSVLTSMNLSQTPVSVFRNTNWNGSSREQDYGGRPMSGTAAQVSIEAGLIPAQLGRLATQLVRVPLLATAERRAEMGGAVSGEQIAGATDPVGHMQNVLTAVLRRNAMDRLFAELTARSSTEEERLVVAQVRRRWGLLSRIAAPLAHFASSVTPKQVRGYYSVVPGAAAELEELDEVLEYLADLPARGGTSPLQRYVARLERLTGKRMSDDWFGLPPQRLRLLRDTEANALSARPCCRLVLDLRAPGSVELTWPATVVGHLLAPNGSWDKRQVDSTPTVAGIGEAVNELLRWAHGRSGGDTVALGFLAPRARFDDTPETWCYSDELTDDVPLGEQYHVVLHCCERLGNRRTYALWEGQLKRIADRLDIGDAPTVHWVERDEAADPRRISQGVQGKDASCIAFGFVPGPFGGALKGDPLMAAIAPGAPYVIWLDEEPPDWDAARRKIEELVRRGEEFHQVPDRAKDVRQGKVDELPAGIRLLWDNKEWLPDFGLLTGLDERASA